MSNILDLIDSAVSDWETGPDAVRYNAGSKRVRLPAGGVMRIGDGPEIPVTDVDLMWQPLAEQANAMAEVMVPFAAYMHTLMTQITSAFKCLPHELGLGYPLCACHPVPFPAARDYRRRTKHRNRRRP